MRVLVVGKGGREHALAKKISESKRLQKIWIAPGNPGMAKMGFECVPCESTPQIVEFCLNELVDLVVLGPEAAILSDLKEQLEAQGISCLAPSHEAAQLEASKLFCKRILQSAGVQTANFEVATDVVTALQILSRHDFVKPLVVKADGLAQGKGVQVCGTFERAQTAVTELSQQFGFPLLFEECLPGRELSAFALCDGEDFIFLGTACDYKRINADFFSANTGGMGAYSPCDFITQQDEAQISEIFRKTLRALRKHGTPFSGFLFAGLMKTERGLYVLEYNVRLGDPETQALLPRIKSDFLEMIVKSLQGRLKTLKTEFHDQPSVHVVAVSGGYPNAPMELGHIIETPAPISPGTEIFFAGVSSRDEFLVNSGGRVLGITAMARTREEARRAAYETMKRVSFKGLYFREDIAQ